MKKLILAAVAAVGLTTSANAATAFFTDASAFEAATVGTDLTLNTFDDALDFGGIVDFGSGIAASFDAGLGTIGNPTGTVGIQTSDSEITFIFEDFINSFGITLFGLGTEGPTSFSAFTDDGGFADLFSDFSNQQENSLFVGITSTDGFSSVTFSNEGFGDILNFDNLVTGGAATIPAVPEPATWLMMIFGFGLVALQMKRRRHTALTPA